MATNAEKITSLQKITSRHENEIGEIKKDSEKNGLILTEILKKLDRLLLLDEQADEKFKHHKLACREELDERYVMKLHLRTGVIEILQSIRHDDLQLSKNKVSIFDSIFNIAWKIASIIGIGYIIFDKLF